MNFSNFYYTEGGMVFGDKTAPIKKENIDITIEKYFEELKRIFPNKASIFNMDTFRTAGSVGKKAVSGDIDLIIDVKYLLPEFNESEVSKWGLSFEELEVSLEKHLKRARTSTREEVAVKSTLKGIGEIIEQKSEIIGVNVKKTTTSGLFTHTPQYDESTGESLNIGVQVDWMVGDEELLKFSYYSDVYDGNIKGLHRTQAILAMFSVLGYTFNHAKGLVDKETKEKVAIKPSDILKVLSDELGYEIDEKIASNYHSLMEIFRNTKYFEDWQQTYFKILDSTRADIPYDLQDDWIRRQDELNLKGKFLPQDSKLIKYQRGV